MTAIQTKEQLAPAYKNMPSLTMTQSEDEPTETIQHVLKSSDQARFRNLLTSGQKSKQTRKPNVFNYAAKDRQHVPSMIAREQKKNNCVGNANFIRIDNFQIGLQKYTQ